MKEDKNKITSTPIPTPKEKTAEEITRKEAFKKAGKYAAVTAAAMFVILSPAKAQGTSDIIPGWGT